MADTKLNDLASGAPAAATDIIYAVKDPSGTPADAKLTLGEVKTLVNTPGGSDTQVQFNDGGAFAGDSGFTFNKTAKALTLTGATITTSSPVIDAAQTWNASGTTFTGLKLNVTDTSSASASLLMDLQVGGTSRFSVSKSGTVAGVSVLGDGVTSLFIIGGVNNRSYYGGTTNGTSLFSLFGGFPASGMRFRSDLAIGWVGGTNVDSTPDLFLTRRAAANLRLGAADAASPVAQTLSVQSVSAGTTNTAGTNLTITGSQGTGTGAGGSIIFQVAPAGSSGTAQNALATALTIGSDRGVVASTYLQVAAGAIVGNSGIYFGTAGGNRAELQATGVGVLALARFGSGDVTFQFGGSSASFPALKRSSASLIVRLADDTANAALESASLKTDAPAGGTAATWKLGTVASVSPTSPNRTIEVDIGGTIYYISAKTTND